MTRLASALFLGVLALSAQSVFNQRRAPGFSIVDSKMKQHDMADYRGKVVLIEFMRTDCPNCQTLSKNLEQIKSKYGDKLQVLSIVTAPPDNMNTVAKYIATYKVTSPILFDCGQVTASYLRITPQNPEVHFPQVVVVDKNGMIRRELKHSEVDSANVIGAIENALK